MTNRLVQLLRRQQVKPEEASIGKRTIHSAPASKRGQYGRRVVEDVWEGYARSPIQNVPGKVRMTPKVQHYHFTKGYRIRTKFNRVVK